MLKSPIDSFCWAVASFWPIEVGKDALSVFFQRFPQAFYLDERFGQVRGCNDLYKLLHEFFTTPSIRLVVGADHPLVHVLGAIHFEVVLICKQLEQLLFVGVRQVADPSQ